jgi:hypothetical protein
MNIPDFCPDCGFPWPYEFDFCPNCHLTLEDIEWNNDYTDDVDDNYPD